ncbi:MAG TPA: hypothetical protein VFE58_09015 [Tepidisphaeraceae bacterium]|jgi:hypothetical protein|nr:hypothetical protein [Tepidisphaeraceae bacterium]
MKNSWLKHFLPTLAAIGATFAGEVIVDSFASGTFEVPTSAEDVLGLIGPATIGAVVGFAGSMVYPEKPVLAAAIGGVSSPILMSSYRWVKTA